eukprot:CAMPEP_0202875026 /NCGR_PEP_ID=MMETSP1391-20130828/26462_1 /ASSEMBLY_ACC=CAM_ASM_000867 /TAXON_ID=1034604 /ORGANISM="Chlamydomonas leiostraca, Strain SAG 11-49" /LENGTH=174 /DNA_ID=CAMNT_0049556609 /DNA_START=371 /DNA_END=895 /DNA_ORIENTATION=-
MVQRSQWLAPPASKQPTTSMQPRRAPPGKLCHAVNQRQLGPPARLPSVSVPHTHALPGHTAYGVCHTNHTSPLSRVNTVNQQARMSAHQSMDDMGWRCLPPPGASEGAHGVTAAHSASAPPPHVNQNQQGCRDGGGGQCKPETSNTHGAWVRFRGALHMPPPASPATNCGGWLQ